MMNLNKPFLPPFTIGGHVFNTVLECATELLVPEAHVIHMLVSDKYQGCRYLTVEETTSYLQTLAVMKTSDG